MIFDAHMHVGDFPLFNVSLDRDGLVALMRGARDYDGAASSTRTTSYVREVVEAMPGRTGSSGRTRACRGTSTRRERFLDHPKFRGVKLHPLLDGYHPNDPSVHPLMELLVERGLPVLDPLRPPDLHAAVVDRGARRVASRSAQVILGHMGHGNIVYINASIDVAARNPNVYLETSGMPMHTKIREAVERVGADRVLYGSDAPFHHPAVEIPKVQRERPRPPDLVERVLGENGRALFFGDAADDVRGRAR